jgi:protein-L-isoaspartate(D-aspartate) O-methyltransferase
MIQYDRMAPVSPDDAEKRRQMVKHYLEKGNPPITDQRVLDTMAMIPRHLFMDAEFQNVAYLNQPQPIGHGQTISQPYIIAYMTQWLDPQPGQRILEIGTGCGYQTAILADFGAEVVTVEIDESLQARAVKTLHSLGYQDIEFHIGNGFSGLPDRAPFDRIIATCACEHPPFTLLEQLSDPGRAIFPVGPKNDQALFGYTRNKGQLMSSKLLPVRFVTNRAPTSES